MVGQFLHGVELPSRRWKFGSLISCYELGSTLFRTNALTSAACSAALTPEAGQMILRCPHSVSAAAAVVATAKNEQDDEDDQKCSGIHGRPPGRNKPEKPGGKFLRVTY